MFENLRDYLYRFPGRKLYSLIDKVYSSRNLEESWEHVKANKGCAGIDRQSLHDFEEKKEQYLGELQRAVRAQTYAATPVLRRYIPKPDGTKRPLGIPVVKDRVLQQAARNVIEAIFEGSFLDCSYGFRPERSAHQAIAEIERGLKEGKWFVVDADIRAFFDSVDHQRLMGLLAEKIADGRVLCLIESWLRAGVMENGKWSATTQGTPQGGVISPLLANIYLHEFDKAISAIPGIILVRYADDFVILCDSMQKAEMALKTAKEVLASMHLELHPDKTRIVKASQEAFEFLGFRFKRNQGQARKRPRQRSLEKFKEAVKTLTRKSQPIPPEDMVGRLNLTIRGWGNYFKIGNVRALFTELDKWIRTRVRSFVEKRKSRWSTKRISNYALRAEYKLASLMALLPRSL